MIKTIIFEIKERYKIPCIIKDALYENDCLENKFMEVVSLKQGLHEVYMSLQVINHFPMFLTESTCRRSSI